MPKAKTITMEDLLSGQETIKGLVAGDVVQGTVAAAEKHQIYLDLGQWGTGLVVRGEMEAGETVKPGDEVSASVLDPETDEGYVILSLKKVAKEKGWDALESRLKNEEIFSVKAYDANKGGLLVEVDGIRGFLPVSQLAAQNYPRVSGADKDEILNRLMALVNKPLEVRILDLDRKQNKLIVSEKEAYREETESKVANLKVGDVVEGVVTGVVDFGIFVNAEGIEGLIHISEIAWDRVEHPAKYVKVGDKVKAKIIAIDNDKLSLSLKQLQPDPWAKEVAKLKVDDLIEGKVTRITPFGAFVRVAPAVEALVHVAELSDEPVEDPSSLLKVGEMRQFKIVTIDPEAHKLSLSLKGATKKPTKIAAAKAKATPKKASTTAKKTTKATKE